MYVLEFAGTDDAFAAREAAHAATAIETVGPGLATARGISPDRLRGLAFTRAADELVARTDSDVDAARAALEVATIDREGTVAVRARDARGTTGVDTQSVERELGAALVARGFEVDLDEPDHELRALFTRSDDEDGICLLGWLAVESVRDYGDRAPTDRPFFQPGSMDPMLARALVNLAGAGPGKTVLDPMCGTGGILIEAAAVGASVLGSDAQPKMVRGAARNLASEIPDTDWGVVRADATRLPLPDDAVDAAVFDTPYGRQSTIQGEGPTQLVAAALAEARRVAGRAVVVGDRDLTEIAEDAGWSLNGRFERRVHRSLVRHVHVLE